ncbi:MAG: hypothetical protein JXA13_12595 [Anaerolineales bacterium]|nr:hypothetical protein [Anaerolineales bacterium]
MPWNGGFARGGVGPFDRQGSLGEAFYLTSGEVPSWNQTPTETARTLGAEPEFAKIPSDLIAAHDPEAMGSLIGDKANSMVFETVRSNALCLILFAKFPG